MLPPQPLFLLSRPLSCTISFEPFLVLLLKLAIPLKFKLTDPFEFLCLFLLELLQLLFNLLLSPKQACVFIKGLDGPAYFQAGAFQIALLLSETHARQSLDNRLLSLALLDF